MSTHSQDGLGTFLRRRRGDASADRGIGPLRGSLLTLLGWMGVTASALAQGQPAPVNLYQPAYQALPAGQFAQPGQIVPVRMASDYERPLDPRIQAMPQTNQKLEVIHHRSQLVITLDKVRRIATSDPAVVEIVQFSDTEFAVLGTGRGVTDLWLWFENQEQPLMYEVTVIRDPALEEQRRLDYGRIERKLALLYPNSKVYLIPLSRKIIVRGQANNTEEAAQIMQIVRGEVIAQEGNLYGGGALDAYFAGGAGYGTDPNDFGRTNGLNGALSSFIVDELKVPGEFQIMVRVRIAELNRSQLRRLGVDWQAIIQDALVPIGTMGTFAANPTFNLTGIFENGSIQVAIDALASNGTAKILEDAQLVVLSGEPAAFLSGGEFAVPTIIGIGGAQGQSTSFRGFGTSIIATPTVVDHDLIRMQIVPELSSVNNSNAVGGIPGVNVKRVQTRVELREGQTIVLGGLFSRREAAEVTRIPFLGEIPAIGWLLFNGKQSTEDENELLIIVTPEIVRPMDADQVPPLPGFYATHPDDHDLYKYNRTEGNPDLGHYQLLPYGNGNGYGQDVGYNIYNPGPFDSQLSPAATGGRYGAPAMGGYQDPSMNYGGSYEQGYGAPTGPMMAPPQNQMPIQYGPGPGAPIPAPAPTPVPPMQPIPAVPQAAYRGQPVQTQRPIQQTSGAVRMNPRAQGYRQSR